MTRSRRRWMICLLAVAVLVLVPHSRAQNRPPILEQIAKTYGLDSFGQVEAIRYTWNGEITGLFKASHVWEWEPETGRISFEGTDKDGKPVKVTYLQSQLNSQPAVVKDMVEPSFVNDNYWLLFPLHAYWDSSATVTEKAMQKLPIGSGTATLVSIKYPAEAGGFTPGDTWDLYVGPNKRVQQFVLSPRRAQAAQPRHCCAQRGRAIRRLVLFFSQLRNTAAPPMESPCIFSSPMWRSS